MNFVGFFSLFVCFVGLFVAKGHEATATTRILWLFKLDLLDLRENNVSKIILVRSDFDLFTFIKSIKILVNYSLT